MPDSPIPQSVTDDLAAIAGAVQMLVNDQQGIPALQTAATAADSALLAAQNALSTDSASILTDIQKLQADIAAINGTPVPPLPGPTPVPPVPGVTSARHVAARR